MKQYGFLCTILFLIHGYAWANIKPKSTQVIQFEVSASAPVKKGKCWTESIATPRKGAWRCMIGNDIYDPCFSTSSEKMVICDMNPAKNKTGLSVALTEPLPKSSMPKKSEKPGMHPFQLRLTDGSVCAPFTGTRISLGKEIIQYGCQNNYCPTPESCQIGILSINRQKPLWMAKIAVYTVGKNGKLDVKAFQNVAIDTVWE